MDQEILNDAQKPKNVVKQEKEKEPSEESYGDYDDSYDDESNFYASEIDDGQISNDLMAMSFKTKKSVAKSKKSKGSKLSKINEKHKI